MYSAEDSGDGGEARTRKDFDFKEATFNFNFKFNFKFITVALARSSWRDAVAGCADASVRLCTCQKLFFGAASEGLESVGHTPSLDLYEANLCKMQCRPQG
mmetsp:Transcript_1927/g.4377  ORF Transcript_1927/g.4377 Transcript_1927/m.4377 type:complete len:101 (+) Transcript_1927:54-356(+)